MPALPSRRSTTILLSLCLALSSCAELGIYRPGGPRPGGPPGGSEVTVQLGISVGEARRIAVSHGLTGRGALPPGIRRNLGRGKPLPPGIARQVVPGGMLVELPRIEGHEWAIAGRDLILIVIGTLVVAEILEDVFE